MELKPRQPHVGPQMRWKIHLEDDEDGKLETNRCAKFVGRVKNNSVK
jgi:hypothetical protein